MLSPSLEHIHDAILTNSCLAVENYVKNGQIPLNLNHASLLPIWSNIVDYNGNLISPNCCPLVVSNGTPHDSISCLHLAVIHCFHHHANSNNNASLEILTCLLANGADASLKLSGIHFRIPTANNNGGMVALENGMTPLDLAVYLKKQHTTVGSTKEFVLNTVISALMDLPTNNKKEPCKIHATSVPTSVLESWRNMLLHSKSYDVVFSCQDGTTLRAHRCILSASSDYFATYLDGAWSTAQQQQDNEHGIYHKTTNSGPVMWAVLQFLYTGILTEPTVATLYQELFRVAHEYQLHELATIVESHCMGNLQVTNVKVLLQLAHLHDSKRLEQACFDFIRLHAVQTLTQPDFVALAQQDETLWNKLTQAVSPKKT